MNERQPYEQLIADKLQQLPVPDADASWRQMKRLLDNDQSPGGGGGRKRFRPGGGGGRWWGAGIIAAALITGIWVYTETRPSPQQELASAKQAAATNADAANKDAPAKNSASGTTTFNNNSTSKTTDQTSTLPSSIPASAPATSPNNHGEGQAANAPDISKGDRNNSDNNSSNNAGNGSSNNTTGALSPASSTASASSLPVAADKDRPASDYSKSLPKKKKPSDKTARNRARRNIPVPGAPANKEKAAVATNTNKTPGNKLHHDKASNDTTQPGTARRRPASNNAGSRNRDLANNHAVNPPGTKISGTEDKSAANRIRIPVTTGVRGNHTNPADEQLLAKQRERREHLRELLYPVPPVEVNSFLAVGDSVNPDKDTSRLLNNKTKALIAKSQQPDKNTAVAKKIKKPFQLNLAVRPFSMKTSSDAWWGAGLSLNAPMAIGGQNRSKYNVNGGSSLLTDYLPSPYVEFHLNPYVYLQTEINLSMPQYTPQLWLFQRVSPMAGTNPPYAQREQSIYVQKLYYFSWPVSLHYSPIDNLYLTTGLQFSSFQSGLALINERRFNALGGGPDSYSSKLVKFKDDSIAAQLRPNEWRWQLGAEYYWNRFTVGMRYNRAFTDLVTAGPPNGVPDIKARNASFLFFLRFNIFEGRQKNNSGNGPLHSLVRY